MKYIKSLLWVICCCSGCSTFNLPAREVSIESQDSPSSVSCTVLVDIDEISGTVDSGAPDHHAITGQCFVTGTGRPFTIRTIETARRRLFWSYRDQHLRWTFFAPGYVALTIFPAEIFLDDSSRERTNPTVAKLGSDSRGNTYLLPTGKMLGTTSFPVDSSRATRS